jgi:NAD(P)-dependent dehydrogenase (short-subunit alcohol dehydrogenase family)
VVVAARATTATTGRSAADRLRRHGVRVTVLAPGASVAELPDATW